MKKTRRSISRAKTYGFHPWLDQVDAIDRIVKETGVKESIVLRKLIDEALAARHQKTTEQELGIKGSARSDSSGAIQALLVRLVEHAEKSMKVQDVELGLLQDILAEARAGRKVSWELLVSKLKERGLNSKDISSRFENETAEAKNFAYGTAKEIKKQQKR